MMIHLGSKLRLILVALFLIVLGLVAMRVTTPAPKNVVVVIEDVVNDMFAEELIEPVHPKSPPTKFYEPSLDADSQPPLKEVRFSPAQVSRESILCVLVLNEADLLADYCLLNAREYVDEQQLDKARAIARQYDDRLKDLRRERSQILEQAGVSIKDPSQRLVQFREKAFRLFAEVNQKIMTEVLSAKERKQIHEKSQRFRAAKQAAAAKSDSVPAADGNLTN